MKRDWSDPNTKREYNLSYYRAHHPNWGKRVVHVITNVKKDAKIADCSICGNSVSVLLRPQPKGRSNWTCAKYFKEKRNAYIKEWRLANPARSKEINRKSYTINAERRRADARTRYLVNPGIGHRMKSGEFKALLDWQHNCCAACKTPFSHLKRPRSGEGERNKTWPEVDHDHNCCPGRKSCGKCVRGLICQICNRILGIARKERWRLPKYLVDYLDLWADIFRSRLQVTLTKRA